MTLILYKRIVIELYHALAYVHKVHVYLCKENLKTSVNLCLFAVVDHRETYIYQRVRVKGHGTHQLIRNLRITRIILTNCDSITVLTLDSIKDYATSTLIDLSD